MSAKKVDDLGQDVEKALLGRWGIPLATGIFGIVVTLLGVYLDRPRDVQAAAPAVAAKDERLQDLKDSDTAQWSKINENAVHLSALEARQTATESQLADLRAEEHETNTFARKILEVVTRRRE